MARSPLNTSANGTGRTLKIGAGIAAGILVLCFCAVMLIRLVEAHTLRKAAENAYSAPPPVDVVTARPASVGQDLVLPGQTAAWFETTIYARVNGYVAKWLVDIGDHVKKGQVLATIETPELDAELSAARAQLKASEAQVSARRAEAEFSKTTNERWRDSPKGVVSEQERESKKADYQSANARLFAADSQVALDKSKVDQYTALAQFKQSGGGVRRGFPSRSARSTLRQHLRNHGRQRIDHHALVSALAQNRPAARICGRTAKFRERTHESRCPRRDPLDRNLRRRVCRDRLARSAESINSLARTMRVEVDMPNADHALLPGTYVNVAFKLQPRGLVEVPAAALIFRSKVTQVARVDANGKIDFQDVTIARDNLKHG